MVSIFVIRTGIILYFRTEAPIGTIDPGFAPPEFYIEGNQERGLGIILQGSGLAIIDIAFLFFASKLNSK